MNRVGLIAVATATFFTWGCGAGVEDDDAGFVPTELAVRADAELKVGTTVQLHAFGMRDGVEREMLKGVTFTSSNEAVATVDASGLATIIAGGPVTFTASYGSLSATVDARPRCEYPRFSPEFALGRVMPKLSWENAYDRDGNYFEFNLEDVYCDADWKNTKTITFVLSAGWCAPCTQYAKELSKIWQDLDELGMKIVTVEVEDERGDPGDADFARMHLEKITAGEVPSIAVGDADTRPARFIASSPFLEYFPTAFVVRTRDMRIIADGKRWNARLPLARIAADPEADWTKEGGTPFRNKCGPGVEESTDNWTPAGALAIGAGSQFGGICQDGADFYSVDAKGTWTLDLAYDHRDGDLDLYVWDAVTNAPLLVDGQVIASTGTEDVERIEYAGPAIVAVVPFQHASGAYELTLTER